MSNKEVKEIVREIVAKIDEVYTREAGIRYWLDLREDILAIIKKVG